MSNNKNHKKQFLEKHPLCCFCGGKTISETIDHFPSRTIFDNRQWPEGYEFPACTNCNAITRDIELIINAVSRVHGAGNIEPKPEEIKRAIQGVKNNQPDVFEEWEATEKQRSQYPTALNIGPKTNSAVKLFGHKLGLALYYFHTGKIITENGGTLIPRWYSNTDHFKDSIPDFITEFRGKNVNLTRQ